VGQTASRGCHELPVNFYRDRGPKKQARRRVLRFEKERLKRVEMEWVLVPPRPAVVVNRESCADSLFKIPVMMMMMMMMMIIIIIIIIIIMKY
jgi:hypothetical protein